MSQAGPWRGPIPVSWVVALGCMCACGARTGLQTDDQAQQDDVAQQGDPAQQGEPTDLVDACNLQRMLYEEFRQQTIEEQTVEPCRSADDCMLFSDRTGCGSSCDLVIPNYAQRGVDDRLYAYASQNCVAGCPTPEQECPAPPSPKCVLGSCQ